MSEHLKAKHLGSTERLKGLRQDWVLIKLMGGPSSKDIDNMTDDEYEPWNDRLRDQLDVRPDVTVHDDGTITMGDEWTLRQKRMRDVNDAVTRGRGSTYKASRALICILAGDKMPEDVDELPVGHYYGLMEAIGGTFR